MPHKRNPIGSENICGCARIMKSYVQVALEDNTLWHERDISHSSAERIMLPDAVSLLDYMLKRMTKILKNLVVYKEKMLEDINMTYGVVFSGYVIQRLIDKGNSREFSYDLIQPLAFKAMEEKRSYKEILIESEVSKYLSSEEIEHCFNIDNYLLSVADIYKRLGWENE